MLDGAAIALIAAGLGVGVVSGLAAVLPAEAYVVAVALTHDRALAVAVAVAVAVGQTAGKVVVCSAVRGAGRSRWLGRLRTRSGAGAALATHGPAPEGSRPPRGGGGPARRSPRRRAVARARTWLARASAVCLAALSGRAGWAVVLLSAATGLPPLLAVTLIAGASSMRRTTFATTCLLGRTALFVAVAAVPGAFRSLFGG